MLNRMKIALAGAALALAAAAAAPALAASAPVEGHVSTAAAVTPVRYGHHHHYHRHDRGRHHGWARAPKSRCYMTWRTRWSPYAHRYVRVRVQVCRPFPRWWGHRWY